MKIVKYDKKPKEYPNQLLNEWQDDIPLSFLMNFYNCGEEDKAIIVEKDMQFNIFTTGELVYNEKEEVCEQLKSLA